MKNLKTTQQFMPSYYHEQNNEVELLTQAWNNQLPVLLKGPTGCGKTRFVQHMAQKLGRKLYTVACHEDLTATDLLGRHLIGDGKTYWQDGPLTKAVREGAICYLDEIVEARKDTIVVLHPLTDDRRILPIDRTGEILQAPAEFMLIASYNPGYQNLLKGMKPSTKQRFIAMKFNYPSIEIETQIIQKEAHIGIDVAKPLAELAYQLRQLKDHDLEETASTRLLIYAASLIKDGISTIEACQSAIIEPLTDDDEVIAALMEVVKAKFIED